MPTQPSPALAVNLAEIYLPTPLALLSGCVGFGEEMVSMPGVDFKAIGAICLKGTTLNPKAGNKPHRLAETPAGLLNAIGLQNPGARAVVDTILPRLLQHRLPCRLIANIAGATVEEYGEVAAIFDNSPVDAIEINISCPNVKEGGAAFGSDPMVASRVVAAVRRATRKPIITKLSPNVTDITVVARAVIEAGSNALSAINTLMGMAIDIKSRRPVLGNVQGGLSGPAIKPVALLKIWQVYQVAKPHNIPILGQGGIATAQDAIEFFMAGSSALGLGTALFRNPNLSATILAGLTAYMESEGITDLTTLTGSLRIG